MKKIKLFTHTDLDGIGCAILAKIKFGENVDIEYCNYDDVNIKVEEFLLGSSKHFYEYIYITDISVNEDVVTIIETEVKDKIKLLDHHKTALWLNKYDWAKVTEIDEELNEKTSGTYMFYKELFNMDGKTKILANVIRKYDTWTWKEKNDLEPKKLNDLMYIYGRDLFINSMIEYCSSPNIDLITYEDEFLLSLKQKEIDNYLENKNKSMIKTSLFGMTVGIIFAERFHSEIGNRLCEMNSDIDLVVIINIDYSISYRTIKDIDLSVIAKQFGGGGHPKASGSPLPEDLKMKIIRHCFG